MAHRLAFGAALALTALGSPAPAAPPPTQPPSPERDKDPRGEWLQQLLEDLRKRQSAPAPKSDGVHGAPQAPDAEGEEEPRADPIKTLEEAARLMSEAEEHLFAAAAKKGLAKGAEAERKLAPPDRPPDGGGGTGTSLEGTPPPDSGKQSLEKMRLAQEKIDKLLGGADRKQKDTIDLINLLIRQARQVEQQSQQEQQRRQQQQQQQRPQSQPQNQPNARNPAEQPYTPPPSREGTAPPRSADRADRWGDLPPHLRDETNQGLRQVEEFPAEYRELLQEYYKRLSGGD